MILGFRVYDFALISFIIAIRGVVCF